MQHTKRLTKKQTEDARLGFWLVWTVLITLPASMTGWLFAYGSWWGSPIGVIISVALGHSIFKYWLKRQQETRDNTLVLCYCAHSEEEHEEDGGKCWYSNDPIRYYSRGCLCNMYTPRFWRMARRT